MREEIKKILGELAGFASLCWSETPKGVFESTQASKAVDQAAQEIVELVERANAGDGCINNCQEGVKWDREKVAACLYDFEDRFYTAWECITETQKEIYYEQADALIRELPGMMRKDV